MSWNEVNMIHVKNEVESETDTYTALADSDDFRQQLYDYLSVLEPVVEGDNSIVGLVVVSGDKILGSDIFASNSLFQKPISQLAARLHHRSDYQRQTTHSFHQGGTGISRPFSKK